MSKCFKLDPHHAFPFQDTAGKLNMIDTLWKAENFSACKPLSLKASNLVYNLALLDYTQLLFINSKDCTYSIFKTQNFNFNKFFAWGSGGGRYISIYIPIYIDI